MRVTPLLVVVLLTFGCSDYSLVGLADVSEEPLDKLPGDDEPAPEPGDEPEDDVQPPEDDGGPTNEKPPPDLPACEDTVMADWQWWGSQPFEDANHPTDDGGLPFYDPDYDMVGYSTVELPDSGHTPPGTDRVYIAWFELWGDPPALFLSMQSDDGMAFWVNGELVGEWGNGWQEEGCVNDDANCSEFVIVDPIDIAPLLHEGWNVVAARVSNPVMNAWFDTYTECVDEEP